MRDQRPTVVEAGQIVVLGQIAELFLGRDTGLKLSEQGGDGFQRVDLFLLPLPVAVLDEAENAGRRLTRDQWSGRDRGRGGGLRSPDPAPERAVGLFGPDHDRFPAEFASGQNRVGAGEVDNGHRVRVRDVDARWPLGHQYRGPNVVVVVAQETGVQIELLDKLLEYVLTHPGRGRARRLHQLGGDGGDDEIQAAWHGLLRYGAHVPSGLGRIGAQSGDVRL